MAINQVTASISFDYKGQNFLLKNEINIDNIISHDDFFNSVYVFIAQENNIDLYSYQFEIMIDQNIVFSPQNHLGMAILIKVFVIRSIKMDLLKLMRKRGFI